MPHQNLLSRFRVAYRTLSFVSYRLVIAKGRSLRLQHCSVHKLLPVEAHNIVGILIGVWLTTSWAWCGCCQSVAKGGSMADHNDELHWRRQAIRLRLKGWRSCEILTRIPANASGCANGGSVSPPWAGKACKISRADPNMHRSPTITKPILLC